MDIGNLPPIDLGAVSRTDSARARRTQRDVKATVNTIAELQHALVVIRAPDNHGNLPTITGVLDPPTIEAVNNFLVQQKRVAVAGFSAKDIERNAKSILEMVKREGAGTAHKTAKPTAVKRNLSTAHKRPTAPAKATIAGEFTCTSGVCVGNNTQAREKGRAFQILVNDFPPDVVPRPIHVDGKIGNHTAQAVRSIIEAAFRRQGKVATQNDLAIAVPEFLAKNLDDIAIKLAAELAEQKKAPKGPDGVVPSGRLPYTVLKNGNVVGDRAFRCYGIALQAQLNRLGQKLVLDGTIGANTMASINRVMSKGRTDWRNMTRAGIAAALPNFILDVEKVADDAGAPAILPGVYKMASQKCALETRQPVVDARYFKGKAVAAPTPPPPPAPTPQQVQPTPQPGSPPPAPPAATFPTDYTVGGLQYQERPDGIVGFGPNAVQFTTLVMAFQKLLAQLSGGSLSGWGLGAAARGSARRRRAPRPRPAQRPVAPGAPPAALPVTPKFQWPYDPSPAGIATGVTGIIDQRTTDRFNQRVLPQTEWSQADQTPWKPSDLAKNLEEVVKATAALVKRGAPAPTPTPPPPRPLARRTPKGRRPVVRRGNGAPAPPQVIYEQAPTPPPVITPSPPAPPASHGDVSGLIAQAVAAGVPEIEARSIVGALINDNAPIEEIRAALAAEAAKYAKPTPVEAPEGTRANETATWPWIAGGIAALLGTAGIIAAAAASQRSAARGAQPSA